MPFIVGITGAIGGGKSEAARAFARLGADVVDADRLGHEALLDPDVRRRLVGLFGEQILGPDDAVSRPELARVVFTHPEARERLEAVTHPAITRRARQAVLASKAPLVVLDAALLLEAGWDAMCDKIVFIDAPEALRLARVRERSGWTEDHLHARERAQMPLTDKRRLADHVVMNDKTPDDLYRQAEGLLRQWGLAPANASTEACPR